jgi:hypothetical protein
MRKKQICLASKQGGGGVVGRAVVAGISVMHVLRLRQGVVRSE